MLYNNDRVLIFYLKNQSDSENELKLPCLLTYAHVTQYTSMPCKINIPTVEIVYHPNPYDIFMVINISFKSDSQISEVLFFSGNEVDGVIS